MEKRKLGSRGPEISVVGYGSWEAGGMWGPNPVDDEMVRTMHAGFDAGIDWVDTAEVYGHGKSEQIVGKALAGRKDVRVFTKVAANPPGSGYDAASVRRACEKSLKNLGRDVIDLYQIHFPTPDMRVEETWGAMAKLQDDGLVRWIGVSNFDRELISLCERIRHVDSLQPEISILRQKGMRELASFCRSNGTGVIAFGPLGYGLLTGAIDEHTKFEGDDWRSGQYQIGPIVMLYNALFAPDARRHHLALVNDLRPVAQRLAITLAQLAIAWVTSLDGVTGAIVGSRSAKRTVENARAGSVKLPADAIAEIDRVARAHAG